MKAFHDGFGCLPEETNSVDFEVAYSGTDTVRSTRIERGGAIQRKSDPTAIRRS